MLQLLKAVVIIEDRISPLSSFSLKDFEKEEAEGAYVVVRF